MSNQLAQLQDATIQQHCKALRMPMMASQFKPLAEQAVREKKTHLGYLEALLDRGQNAVGPRGFGKLELDQHARQAEADNPGIEAHADPAERFGC